jgi:hypothetical protein
VDITKFPVKHWQRIKNRRGTTSVNCIVSSRYLKVLCIAETDTADGAVVTIHVMVDKYEDGPDRRLCELILPIEELRDALAKAESKLS